MIAWTALCSMRALVVAGVLLPPLLGGCATSGERVWGADATIRPGMDRFREVTLDAVKNPRVWVPLAGAAVFQIDHWDRHVSNWARDKTPIFGSESKAADWSDRLRTASSVAYFATVLATPGADTPSEWFKDKLFGLSVGLGAIGVTGGLTTVLKDTTGRTRPNGEGTQSFPSGHTSHSAVTTGLARDNLLYMDISDGTRLALDIGLDALTAGTAWARIEAGAHFPADTLFGMSLGYFISYVFDRTFLDPHLDGAVSWAVTPVPGGLALNWEARF